MISRFGRVDNQEVNQIVATMKECYNRLAPHEVELVDLYIFERSSSVEAFLAEESKRVGVASSSFDELFFSMHDAWRGTPRVVVCLERMKKLSTLTQIGGIRHETGHSVLHGSLRHYIFPLPPALIDFAKRFELSQKYVTNMLYLISIAVKDYEVSHKLHKHGYLEDQIALAKHMLEPTESDKTSWEISRGKADAEALCLISHLKSIGYATPFLTNQEIQHRIRESLSYLPKKHSEKLFEQTPKIFQQLGSDTLSNINKLTHQIIRKLVEPIFQKRSSIRQGS
jgi:hypothetical protein